MQTQDLFIFGYWITAHGSALDTSAKAPSLGLVNDVYKQRKMK